MAIDNFVPGHWYRYRDDGPRNLPTNEGWAIDMNAVWDGVPRLATERDGRRLGYLWSVSERAYLGCGLPGSVWSWRGYMEYFDDVTEAVLAGEYPDVYTPPVRPQVSQAQVRLDPNGNPLPDGMDVWRIVDPTNNIRWHIFDSQGPWWRCGNERDMPHVGETQWIPPTDQKWEILDHDNPVFSGWQYFVGPYPPKGQNLEIRYGNHRSNEKPLYAGPYVPDATEDCGECYHCHRSIPNRFMRHLGEVSLCARDYDNHVIQCYGCGTRFYQNPEEENPTGVCPTCAPHYVVCDNCEGTIHIDNSYPGRNGEGVYCEDCKPKRIKSYDYGPPEFHFYGEGSVHMGCELEIENGKDGDILIESYDPDEKHFYMKRDGSLMSSGIEIVTHPHTLPELLAIYWKDMFAKLRAKGYTSHDNGDCGLHFHLSRDYLGEQGTANLLYLAEKYKESLFIFSRRTRTSFNRWAKHYFDSHEDLMGQCKKLGNFAERFDRYRMINLKNDATVELRFFRGTLRYETFVASAQLAHTLAEIASKEPEARVKNISFPSIIRYYGFPELLTYWKNRKGGEEESDNQSETPTVTHHIPSMARNGQDYTTSQTSTMTYPNNIV